VILTIKASDQVKRMEHILTYEQFVLGLDKMSQKERGIEEIAKGQNVTATLPAGDERILLVDDEESVVLTSVRTLRDLGYSVIGKTSSAEALQLFQEYPEDFDLIVVDMIMPEMTGEVLAEEILKIRRDIPIIMITGYDTIVDKDKFEDLGIKQVFPKPFSKSQLANYVRNTLDNNKI
jgi:CheY-like chemotaxis protein